MLFNEKKNHDKTQSYAVISFWHYNDSGEQQVQKPHFISGPLSRVVNAANDLREVLFTGYNFNLVFLFNKGPIDESERQQLMLSIVG